MEAMGTERTDVIRKHCSKTQPRGKEKEVDSNELYCKSVFYAVKYGKHF